MCRIAASSSANRNSCTDPAKITVSPPVSRRRRSRGEGIPSRMAEAAADIPAAYQYLTYYAKYYGQSAQVRSTLSGDLGPTNVPRQRLRVVAQIGYFDL